MSADSSGAAPRDHAASSGPGAATTPTPPLPTPAAASPTTTAETPTSLHTHGVHHRPEENPTGRKLAVLTLTALGVVYGDIGTSPLYSIKECFKPEFGLAPSIANVYGVLSLIVWSLVLVVSVKYVMYLSLIHI